MTEGTPPTPPTDPPDGPPIDPEPVATEHPVPSERSDLPRQAALGTVVFFAVLLLLIGATALIRRAPAAAPGSSPSAAVVPSPSVASSNSPSPLESPPESPSAGQSSSPGAPSGSAATASGDPTSLPTIAAATPKPPPATLVGAGDIGDCGSDGDEATAALVDAIDGTVFTAGDNAYGNGSAANFAECYDPSWGPFKDRTRPAAGNHDWETDKAQGYRDYFGAAAVGPDGGTWYSYELATWHIVVLDSDCGKVGGCGPDTAQGRWLAADLAASSTQCTLAIWHHPRFSSGEHGNDKEVDPFWQALYAAGADVIVNGHDHDYERFAPQDPNGQEDRDRGIREFVVGTGGTALRDFSSTLAANSELRLSVANGVIEFTLRDGGYDWHMHLTSTDISDSGTANCH